MPQKNTSGKATSIPTELDPFLAPLPDWLRKIFTHGFTAKAGLTGADLLASMNEFTVRNWIEFEDICRRSGPKVWQWYVKLHGSMKIPIAPNPGGRPRKDQLADEGIELQQDGLSYRRIAHMINRKYGEGTTTPSAMRMLIQRRQGRTSTKARRKKT